MKLQPIVYTASMDRAVEWYSKVLDTEPVYRSEVWTSFQVGDAALALHRAADVPERSKVGLSLIATDRLEEVVNRLTDAGLHIERGIQEETFGRSLLLTDPDGLVIQVNEHDHG